MNHEHYQRVEKHPTVHGTGLRRRTSLKGTTLAFSISVTLLVAGVVGIAPRQKGTQSAPTTSETEDFRKTNAATDPSTLAELLTLRPAQLAQCDIALMNLLCTEGLPGAEGLNVVESLQRLDGIAKHVEFETKRHIYRFRNNPDEFNRSEGYFRMLFMAVTLQEDLGVRYNPERITAVGDFEPNEIFFADSRDVFLHGLIADDRRMGTCASMPVLYVAIGRRLGYPLKLVPTQNHLFVRWEDNRERFNVDATGRGMNMYDDNHYRQWPMPISREQEQELGYLKSMTTTDELTAFLGLRGHCLFAIGKIREGVEAHEMALRFSPNSRLQQLVTAEARERLQPQSSFAAYVLPELRGPFSPRPRLVATQPQGVPGIASPIPIDPNPINSIRNQ